MLGLRCKGQVILAIRASLNLLLSAYIASRNLTTVP